MSVHEEAQVDNKLLMLNLCDYKKTPCSEVPQHSFEIIPFAE